MKTFIEPAGFTRRQKDEWYRQNDITSAPLSQGILYWGRVRLSGDRWHWAVFKISGELYAPTYEGHDGMAGSEAEALAAAEAAIWAHYPEDCLFLYRVKHVKDRYKALYGKNRQGKFKCADLNGSQMVWLRRCDEYLGKYLIKGVTEKYVYLSKEPVWGTLLQVGDINSRDGYHRILRADIDNGASYGYTLTPPSEAAKIKEALTCEQKLELRREMQRHHPDKGGDPEKFHAARARYAAVKRL